MLGCRRGERPGHEHAHPDLPDARMPGRPNPPDAPDGGMSQTPDALDFRIRWLLVLGDCYAGVHSPVPVRAGFLRAPRMLVCSDDRMLWRPADVFGCPGSGDLWTPNIPGDADGDPTWRVRLRDADGNLAWCVRCALWTKTPPFRDFCGFRLPSVGCLSGKHLLKGVCFRLFVEKDNESRRFCPIRIEIPPVAPF